MTATAVAGFIGAALAGAAYVPQIWHLIHERCSAGISRPAFMVWLGASVLLMPNAVSIGAVVFVALGILQIVAISIVLVCATKYRRRSCVTHSMPSAAIPLSARAPSAPLTKVA